MKSKRSKTNNKQKYNSHHDQNNTQNLEDDIGDISQITKEDDGLNIEGEISNIDHEGSLQNNLPNMNEYEVNDTGDGNEYTDDKDEYIDDDIDGDDPAEISNGRNDEVINELGNTHEKIIEVL